MIRVLTSNRILGLLAGLLAATALSCGGGGGSLVADGGIGGSGIASFGVAEVGSVTVNDVTFDTSEALILIDGALADESLLHDGMVLRVEGVLDQGGTTGVADEVRFEDEIKGPVTALQTSPSGRVKTLTVLGQTVLVESNGASPDGTIFDTAGGSFGFDQLAIGQVIEVSGLHRADGTVVATFLRKLADDLPSYTGQLEVRGRISGFTGGNTFSINDLTVDITGATAAEGELADGLLVEVKGDVLSGTALLATALEIEAEGLSVSEIDRAEIEGFIHDFDAESRSFRIHGQPVRYGNALFKGGLAIELAEGIRVEVEGPIASGVLEAEQIEFQESIKLRGNAAIIDPVAGTLGLEALSPPILITVEKGVTSFRGGALGLDDLQVENHLKIRARQSGAGTLIATRIEVSDLQPSSRVELQGPVESFDADAGTLTILGVTVSGIPATGFSIDDLRVEEETFFSALGPDTLVEAEGRLSDAIPASIDWTEVEIE